MTVPDLSAVPALAALKQALAGHYGSRMAGLLLFGSRARGDNESGSDFDLLVTLRGDVDPETEIRATGPLMAALSLRHDAVLSCVFVPETVFRRESSPLMINIRREGIAV
jgi:predicted nucleotidyltransferase